MNSFIKALFVTVIALSLLACSKANDKAPNVNPVTGRHPSGWAVEGTGGKHPAAYIAGPSACFECHGKNMNGGISGVSCFSSSFNGISCHPAGPLAGHTEGWSAPGAHGASAKAKAEGRDGIAHCGVCHGSDFAGGRVNKSCLDTAGCHGAGVAAPHSRAPWRSTIGGRTHTNTDASNAAGCAICHLNGENSTRQPSPLAPAGTEPGCFNNTLCHGVEGHPSGWSAPAAHGAAAIAPATGNAGLRSCSVCHGAQYDGGTAEQSCFPCHGVNAPHPSAPWLSTTGGLSHTKVDTSNAGQCAICHRNSTQAGIEPGCFNNTLCHGVIGHPAGWQAPAQHGAAAKKAPTATTGFSSCQLCHGPAFTNGSAVSCLNNASCHGSGIYSPHPRRPWFSAAGLTHTNTNTANAGTCAICHTAGANSTVTPPAPATLTIAGCFNNTLCHFHQIPFAPSATIPASLHGGEAKKNLLVCQACHGVVGTTAFDGLALAVGRTTACSGCHTFAKAHPTDWQGSGTYSHRTAGNIADACSICHDVTQGRTAPLSSSPSCFSATFANGLGQTRTCHASGAGEAPHAVPYVNHNVTARTNFPDCLGCHQVAANTTSPPGCMNCHLTSPVATPTNCTSCHANPPNGPSYPNIAGSHASHSNLNVSNICGECHSGLGLGTVDHLERSRLRASSVLPNPVVFGVLARTGGLAPTFNLGTGVCSNTYCHGASLAGGSNKLPQWGQTGYMAGCGTCHGYPPPTSDHDGVGPTDCKGCHPHVNAAGTGFDDPSLHINGTINAQGGGVSHAFPNPGSLHKSATNGTGCRSASCHPADAAGSPYPVASGTPPNCRGCHLNSSPTTDPHCSDCHGSATATDGRPNGSTFPNRQGGHNRSQHRRTCTTCHPFTTGNALHGWSNRQKSTAARVGGAGTSITSWNPTTKSCSPTCHGTERW